ncbi:polysaccharide deacetylase family protein [Sphingomonas sp. ASV193]|uniref:polysaccharide deacetylase family protein n=1 Tax=Sphingomonas sp. ASV193 TaxID=3144405 RepID=UPI0032E887D3
MSARFRLSAAAAIGLLSPAAHAARPAPIEVAMTIDDAPMHAPFPPGESIASVNRALIAALARGGVREVTLFVNGIGTERSSEGRAALEAWRRAGVRFGNHTWTHGNIDEVGVAAFEADIAKGEPLLAELGGTGDEHWLRFPYLAEGKDAATRGAVRGWLADRRYRIAAVSLSFGDWQWTGPLARCAAQGNRAALAELDRRYLAAAADEIARARRQDRLSGHPFPRVLLMHDSAMTARMMPRLLALYRRLGVRWIGLARAERDPAYASDVDPRRAPAERHWLDRPADLPPRDDGGALNAICPAPAAAG